MEYTATLGLMAKAAPVKPLKAKLIRWPELRTGGGHKRRPGARHKRLYYDLWLYRGEQWENTVRAYEANPGDFRNAWEYLDNHPIYWKLRRWEEGKVPHLRDVEEGNGFGNGGVWMNVTSVDPATGQRSNDPRLNTRTEIWLETGEWAWGRLDKYHVDHNSHFHNYKLDCGGATYEEAVIRMARKVHGYYGNDRRKCNPEYAERKRVKGDKRLKKDFGSNASVMVTNPYGHACRHRYPPGMAGIIARAKATTEVK